VIPDTKNGLPAMGCVSAMQKCIRRGMEREAMEFACELIHTSKAFHTMVCNRLEVIAHEDIDSVNAPWIVPYIAAAVAQSKERYGKNPDNPGEARLMVGNAIRLLCRAPKSREGCHFGAAIGLRSILEGFAPQIPDWANDQHTVEGKRKGRGIDYFREESAKLHPPQAGGKDQYEDEAYRLWTLKERAARPAARQGASRQAALPLAVSVRGDKAGYRRKAGG
jgi:replication-associated recombination protein RarA